MKKCLAILLCFLMLVNTGSLAFYGSIYDTAEVSQQIVEEKEEKGIKEIIPSQLTITSLLAAGTIEKIVDEDMLLLSPFVLPPVGPPPEVVQL